jgi:REP element-mobilizing transposase RayT
MMMVNDMDNELPKRKELRLKKFDYSTPAAYFITMCTHDRKNTLSHIVGAIRESPLRGRSTVSKVVGYIKMNSSKEIHSRYGETKVWQRGFYDHVIRNQYDYEEIANYIYLNPTRWQADKLYREE